MKAAPGWHEGQDSGEDPESRETRVVVTFWPRGSGVDTIEAASQSDLSERVAVASAEGRPTLLRSGRDRAVIFSAVELKRVLADTPIRVEAYYDDKASV